MEVVLSRGSPSVSCTQKPQIVPHSSRRIQEVLGRHVGYHHRPGSVGVPGFWEGSECRGQVMFGNVVLPVEGFRVTSVCSRGSRKLDLDLG